MSRQRLLPYLELMGLTLALYAWFSFPAIFSVVDPQEGVYLEAAQLVLDGHRPYRDFFYHQMPYFPYLSAIWLSVFGQAWESARLMTAAASAFLGVSIYRYLNWRLRDRRAGLLGALVWATSSLVLSACPRFNVYAWSGLLAFLAWDLLERATEWRGQWRIYSLFGSGLCLGFAGGISVDCWGLILVFLFVICRTIASGGGLRAFLGGLAIALSPLTVVLISSPRAFLCCLTMPGFLQEFNEKLRIAMRAVAVQSVQTNMSFQLVLLSICCLGAVLWGRVQKRPLSTAFLSLAALWVTVLLQTCIQLESFVTLMPFLVVIAVEMLNEARLFLAQSKDSQAWLRRIVNWALLVWCGSLFLQLPPQVGRPWIPSSSPPPIGFEISEIRTVSRKIDELTRPAEPVFSSWPGYLPESHATLLPGLENHRDVEIQIECANDGLLSKEMVENIIARRTVRLFVLGNQRAKWNLEPALRSHGYNLYGVAGKNVEFYLIDAQNLETRLHR